MPRKMGTRLPPRVEVVSSLLAQRKSSSTARSGGERGNGGGSVKPHDSADKEAPCGWMQRLVRFFDSLPFWAIVVIFGGGAILIGFMLGWPYRIPLSSSQHERYTDLVHHRSQIPVPQQKVEPYKAHASCRCRCCLFEMREDDRTLIRPSQPSQTLSTEAATPPISE